MTRLPSLGPRGEGWVAIQVLLLIAVVVAGNETGDAWDGVAATITTTLGVSLLGSGAALLLWGTLNLGRSLTPMPRPLAGATLVKSGAYALVRHPLYGGLSLGAFGWGLLAASPLSLLLAAVLMGFFDLKSRREEAWLIVHYEGYADYMGHTRRLIPWVY